MKGTARLLPDEIPRDPIHAHLLTEVAERKLHPVAAMDLFHFPLLGFHTTLYWISMHWLSWRQAGSHVLEVEPGLQDALANTSLEGVEPGDVKLPHRAVWFAFPGTGLKVWGGERTLWHKADGAWVSITKGERTQQNPSTGEWKTIKVEGDDPGALNILVWGSENDRSENDGDDACMWWTLDLKEAQESDLDLEAYLTQMLSDPTKDQALDAASLIFGTRTALPKGATRASMSLEMVKCARVLINAALYANTSGAIIEESPESQERHQKRVDLGRRIDRAKAAGKKKRYIQKLAQIRPTRLWRLGGATQGPRKKAGQHWVRGHWWPKKANVRKWLASASDLTEQLREDLQRERQSLSSPGCPTSTAEKLEGIVALSDLLREAESREQNLQDNLSRKLRWVAPYERNKKDEQAGGSE